MFVADDLSARGILVVVKRGLEGRWLSERFVGQELGHAPEPVWFIPPALVGKQDLSKVGCPSWELLIVPAEFARGPPFQCVRVSSPARKLTQWSVDVSRNYCEIDPPSCRSLLISYVSTFKLPCRRIARNGSTPSRYEER